MIQRESFRLNNFSLFESGDVMKTATIGNVGGTVSANFVAFSTVYVVKTENAQGQSQEFQTEDVQSMLNRVQTCQELSDSVEIIVTRYRRTGLELSNPVQVCSYRRDIVPAPGHLSAFGNGQSVFSFDGSDIVPVNIGSTLSGWKTLLDWPIKPSGVVSVNFETERERILTLANTRKSAMSGERYRNTVPEFTLDNVDDDFVLGILTETDKLEFEVTEENVTKTIRYNPLRTNYYRKRADRFHRDGFDGHNIQDIAKSIFATVWLESRQRFPGTWTAVTYRQRYIGKIRSQRWIQARINKGLSFNNSEEWKGKENVERLTECENETHFILLLSSYAMARAIQEIVQPFKMEREDMLQLQNSKADAIVLENFDSLTEFERSVAKLLMTDHTERQCAEKLGTDRTKIRQAKLRIKVKLSGQLRE